MTFTVVDVNGLNGSLSWGMNQHGGKLLQRTGYLNLGQAIVKANASLWGDGWVDTIDPSLPHEWEKWELGELADVVVAVPPCSGFSLLTGKGLSRGTGNAVNAGAAHPMNDCMWSSARYAARHAPQVYVFESVTGAYRRGYEVMQGLHAEIERITGERYTLTHWLHDCAVLGSPTSRQRYMFVCVKGDVPFGVTPVDEYAATELTTTRDAIGDLGLMATGRGLRRIPKPALAGQFGRDRQRADFMVDGHFNNTDLRAEKGLPPPKWHAQVRDIAATLKAAGGSWREGQTEPDALRALYQTAGMEPLIAIEGEKRAGKFVQNDFNLGAYFATRLIWDAPCGVISGSGGDSFIHPEQDRLLTLRECARIQGWPDELVIEFDQKVFGKEHITAVWGKAVTPPVADHAAGEIAEWLEHPVAPGKTIGEKIGDREYLIDDLGPSRVLRKMASDLRRKALVG